MGYHTLAELGGCEPAGIATVAAVESVFLAALSRHGATVLGHTAHQFSPEGATVVVMLAESHASLHTWPELGAVCLDFFSCSDALQVQAAIDDLAAEFGAADQSIRRFARPVPGKPPQ